MFNYLGIDYGTKKIGFSLGEQKTCMVIPLETLKNDTAVFDMIRKLCKEHPIQAVVVGRPIHLDGKETVMTQKVDTFVQTLRELIQPDIVTEDERLTTKMAEKKMSRNEKTVDSDAMAAMIILEGYLQKKASCDYDV